MKKLLAIVLVLVLVFAFSACGNRDNSGTYSADDGEVSDNQGSAAGQNSANGQQSNGNTTAITRDDALSIALEQAGVTENDIRDLEIELDSDRGTDVWEVDFESGNNEYSYDINAETGDITERDRNLDF